MKRALEISVFLCIFSLAFLPGKASGFISPCSSITPPFTSTGAKPNILIILSNSQQWDEDFNGNAVGSYAENSQSVAARTALQGLLSTLEQEANVGLMTFTLPNGSNDSTYAGASGCGPIGGDCNVTSTTLGNSLPFASYNPNTYCSSSSVTPAAITACQNYCTYGPTDTTDQAACNAGCGASFTTQVFTFDDGKTSHFPDEILADTTDYPYSTAGNPDPTRQSYCQAIYPKTQSTSISGETVYYNIPDPMYNSGTGSYFAYCGKPPGGAYYSTTDQATTTTNSYNVYTGKTGTSDLYSGYTGSDGSATVQPTDSDWALGYYNFGPNLPWYYIGYAWFNGNCVTSGEQGYLHVPVGDINPSDANNQYSAIDNILNPEEYTGASPSDSSYMTSCTASDKNTCSYIVNAGNTPVAGALQSALDYFNGTYKLPGDSTATATPITSPCQQNFIILVTDGLPDTLLNGTETVNLSTVMPQVTALLQELDGQAEPSTLPTGLSSWTNVQHSGATETIPTYVLAVGNEANAAANFDAMAQAGGTGQAYFATDPDQLTSALQQINANIQSTVGSGTSVSVLATQTQDGGNMLYGVLYPEKYFGTTVIAWPGYLYDWWYYNGPVYQNIREDNDNNNILNLVDDYGLDFTTNPQTYALAVQQLQDPTGSGDPTVDVGPPVGLDSLTPIWEAGHMLWQTSASSRQIYTPGSGSNGLASFSTSNTALVPTTGTSPLGDPNTFNQCLQASTPSATLQNLISYVTGNDISNSFCSNGNGDFRTPYVACTSNSKCSSYTGYTTCQAFSCRSRTVGLCTDGNGDVSYTPCSSGSDCTSGSYTTCTQKTWKLGDIDYSSPVVATNYEYCAAPGSNGSYTFPSTSALTPCTSNANCNTPYPDCEPMESVAFVGANDGMLHAFQTGVLQSMKTPPQVEQLTGIPYSQTGTELWAFIPKNVLPYLRCLAVPPPNGCHLYYNDLTPYITTMNVDTTNSSGVVTATTPHTVLIGGLRLGGGAVTGASANYCFDSAGISNGTGCSSGNASACSSTKYCLDSAGVSNGVTCSSTSSCSAPYNASCAAYNSSCTSAYPTNAPADTCGGGYVPAGDTYDPSNCTGLSSYYALDITNPNSPVLLWEFSDPQLGYSYSGPAVIHKWSTPGTTPPSGDQYDVMFLSGPTDAANGTSNQDVQAFVLTLNANLGISSVYRKDLGATTANGFGGRLFTNGLDVDGDGYTDFVFFGYTSDPGGNTANMGGGIGKIFTDAVTSTTNSSGQQTSTINYTNGMEPVDWTYDVTTYANMLPSGQSSAPITAQVATEQCFNTWYLYTGTGRFFFPQDNYGNQQNYIMGIPFTCNDLNQGCGTPALNLVNSTDNVCSELSSDPSDLPQAGWMIDLSGASSGYVSERTITDPTTSTPSSGNGGNSIYFTTTTPTSNQCGYNGTTYMWGLNCATAAVITDTTCSGYMNTNAGGDIYLQTSTGAITQITNSSFTSYGDKKTAGIAGIAPETHPQVTPTGAAAAAGVPSGQLIQWIEK